MAEQTKGKKYKFKAAIRKSKGANKGSTYYRYFETAEQAAAAEKKAAGSMAEIKKSKEKYLATQSKKMTAAKAKANEVSQLRVKLEAERQKRKAELQRQVAEIRARLNRRLNAGKGTKKKGKKGKAKV